MSFSNTAENAILNLLFLAAAWADIAENDTSSPNTNIAMAAHTADPGEGGTQSTNETSYGSYTRPNVARSGTGFTTPASGATNLQANCDFPVASSGTATLTHFSAGKTGGGASDIHMSGTITPNISVTTGVQPRLTTATTFTID